MSKKIWNVKFIAGNPEFFTAVKIADKSPFTRAAANEAFENLASKGWRVWVEHVDTGERIAESSAEKQYLTQWNHSKYVKAEEIING